MQFNELKNNVSFMFQQDGKEDDAAYAFYLREALYPFKNTPGDLAKVWEQIKEYDGMKKRPNFGFFIGIASGARKSGASGFAYYHCECGESLSESSEGGCPSCRSASKTEHRYAKAPVNVTVCQSACFDCSIYTDFVMCAGCKDFGTPAYLDCKDKSKCKGRTCCKFEYMRTYKPKELKPDYQKALRSLPPTISEAGKMFQAGTVSPVDIKGYLKRNEA